MVQYEITNVPSPIDFEGCTDILSRTIQNAKNLLMCRRGEIPYDRQRGIDPALFDLPLPEAEELLMQELDRAMLWEPDVEVVSGWLERNNEGTVIIHCVVETDVDEESE